MSPRDHLSTAFFTSSLLPLSSAMVRQIPFPQGREFHGLLPLPILKIFESQVEKLWPVASFTWTTLKEPGCLSWLVTTPVLLRLTPLVTTHQCQIWLNQYSFQSPSQFEWCHSPWWGNQGWIKGSGWCEHRGSPDEGFLLSPQRSFPLRLACTWPPQV